MTVTIRRATIDDIEAIQQIGHATWPTTYGFAGEAYVADGLATWWSTEAVARSLETTETLVAELDGVMVGIGNLDLRRDPPTIWKLYVVPSAQGHRVGSALLRQLIVLAADRPVALEYVDGNDRAAEFYRRQGFVEVGREEPDEAGGPETVWMKRTPTTTIG